jgi:hypothetical protein
MIYFKNAAGDVFAYENQAERDQFGPDDLVAMTEAEVSDYLSPPETYQHELGLLNAAYKLEVDKFNGAYALTLLSDGPGEAAKLAAIRAQYEVLKADHAASIAALKIKYGV